ncbi:MAG: hypothetical protein OXU20_17150 [Myxococcales bacterium]|nr:hypothetical protein [Myxococcales bacterium]
MSESIARTGRLLRASQGLGARLAQARANVPEVARALQVLAGQERGGETDASEVEAGVQLILGALACARVAHRLAGSGPFDLVAADNELPVIDVELLPLLSWVMTEREVIAPLVGELVDAPLTVDGIAPLYEGILGARDRQRRRRHGVFHTPTSVAAHLVEQVDAELVELGLSHGLADLRSYASLSLSPPPGLSAKAPVLQIVEPAAGLGVFLREILRLVHRRLAVEDPTVFAERVSAGWLERLHGYELLPVPAALCRMHLSVALLELGCARDLARRIGLHCDNFLTRVLEDDPRLRATTVVVGNPPYARGSQNRSAPMQKLIAPYKQGLDDERNLQPLSDDYIKFVRATELLMQGVPLGVTGLVTNHTFLRGRLHRTMRRSLGRTFSRIDVLDLHGNTKVRRPGERDENVFPISQGVAVSLFVRVPRTSGGSDALPEGRLAGEPAGGSVDGGSATLRYAELRGRRQEKLRRLSRREAPVLRPLSRQPLDSFAPVEHVPREYAQFIPLPDLFEYHSVGGKPGDDRMLVGFEQHELIEKLERCSGQLLAGHEPTTEAARKLARRPSGKPFSPDSVIPYTYRPFDDRLAYYEPEIWTRPLRALRSQVDGSPLLLTTRIVKDSQFAHVFTTRCFPDVIALSTTSSVNCYAFPSTRIVEQRIARGTGLDLSQSEAFAYVYATLHSPTYRRRYVGALRTDFPRVPIGRDPALVAALVARGGRLLRVHLGEGRVSGHRPHFIDGGDRVVRATEMRMGTTTEVAVNSVSRFIDLPVGCWDFRVGGYQVCRKWLSDRQRAGRPLTDADVGHYCDMIARIDETLQVQRDIDDIVGRHGGWPSAFL